MSREQSDAEYKPHFKAKGTRHTHCRTRHREERKQYTGYDSNSAISSTIVDEVEANQCYLPDVENTHSRKQGTGNMARQDKTPMDSMMEMFLKMREDDLTKKDKRERERIERENLREERDRRNGRGKT